MMKSQGKFHIIHRPEARYEVDIIDEPLPVLWDFDGSFCIIPVSVLQNAIDNKTAYDKANDKTTVPQVYIHWDQGIPISNTVGRVLMGE